MMLKMDDIKELRECLKKLGANRDDMEALVIAIIKKTKLEKASAITGFDKPKLSRIQNGKIKMSDGDLYSCFMSLTNGGKKK
jgi:hypothetical protein